ncbi:MAG: CPBP family intramembrane glutamic endopeptidase, partial [Terriglobales bacterium]
PRSGLEVFLFLALCLTAGICEEIIFRGYLQRQFSAWGHTAVVGIVLQSLLFGSSHGYEGATRMLLIAAEGALLGLVAYWRKSLRPGMFAHSAQDAIAGVALRFFLK